MARPRIHTNNAARQRQYRARVSAKAAKVIQSDEWFTPSEYIELAREVMGGIDLDPASCEFAQRVVKADRFYTRDDDGLSQEWVGRIWLNPPYSRRLIGKFVDKLVAEWWARNVTEAVVLTHNRTDTKWFSKLASVSVCRCDTDGRIRFETADGVGNSPPNGSTFFYFGKDPSRFFQIFRDIGNVMWSV